MATITGTKPSVGFIDAILVLPSGKAYFFLGNILGGQYVRFDIDADRVDRFYPKDVSDHWPGVFPGGVDAAVLWNAEKAYFFRGDRYVRYDIAADRVDPGYPKPTAVGWPTLAAVFPDGIDAALPWTDEKAYFFRGDRYVRYDVEADRVDPGYPKPIAVGWPTLASAFPDGIDTAVLWNAEKAYFFRGDQYVRYDVEADRVDAGYPKPIAAGWPTLASTISSFGPGTGSPLDPKQLDPKKFPSSPTTDAGMSWVHVDTSATIPPVLAGQATALIGQIYFGTDKDQPESQGFSELQEIIDRYPAMLNRPNVDRVSFRFEGFADFRHTPEHNRDLSRRRAENVRDFISDGLTGGAGVHPKFDSVVIPRGEDVRSQNLPPDSLVLAGFRRVDIYAPPFQKPLPKPPKDVPIPRLHSHSFEAVVTNLGGGTLPPPVPAGIIAYALALTDLTNNRRMFFRFVGAAGGLSLKLPNKLPSTLPKIAAPKSLDPQKFTTRMPLKLEHFEGWAFYGNGDTGAFGSSHVIVFLGPQQVGDAVTLHWFEAKPKIIGPPAGTAAFGTLVPTGGPVPV